MGSDLRKPYAEVMPYLMQVRDQDDELVPGYRTLNVIGLTSGRRGLLYHRLFISHAPDFVSEPAEVQEALQTVSQALAPLKKQKTITWLLDSGFDDVAVWRTIWEQQKHVVSRIYHTERTVAVQDQEGQWQQGDIARARAHLRPLARVETTLEVKRGRQARPKKQPLMRGLSRLVEMQATQAILSRYASEHEGLPPNIATFLQGWSLPMSYEWMSV
jgi:hypothetical protein